MTVVSLIAAVDEAGGLGLNNQLLCHLPADLKHFKQLTVGKPIIMGRKTFESIGRPLPNRQNIILSKEQNHIDGAIIVGSLDKAIDVVGSVPEIMIIGGANVYQQSFAKANRIYLTVIHHHFEADVYFPQIDKRIWTCLSSDFRPKDENNPYDMTFYTYDRK